MDVSCNLYPRRTSFLSDFPQSSHLLSSVLDPVKRCTFCDIKTAAYSDYDNSFSLTTKSHWKRSKSMAQEANDMIDDNEEKKADNIVGGFDNQLFAIMSAENKDKASLILSSLSILIAMTVCMCGAQKNTLKQMLDVLYPNAKNKEVSVENAQKLTAEAMDICQHYNKKYDGNKDIPIIKIANKIWIEKGFKILDSYIKATGVSSVDTIDVSDVEQAADIVNLWCAQNTNDMIQKVVSADDMDGAKMLIANAIYFNGKFINNFPKNKTKKNVSFYMDNKCNKELSKVSMMTADPKKQQYFAQKVRGVYDVVKLQYKSSKLSLILAINNHSKNENVPVFTTNDILSIDKWNHSKLYLYVPKFKFEFELKLNEILKKMGITDAFDGKADFSGMNGKTDLCIDTVIHKAIIEVDEEGTEAAAVTVVKMRKKSKKKSGPAPPTIRYDHPFDFYIFDEEKNMTLFSGRYVGK